jgi:ubiquinone biosynthesis protein COQ9
MFRAMRIMRKFATEAPSKAELEEKIILASLLHVNKTGFTDEALSRACDDLDLSSASNRLVEDGPIAIVHHILDESEA